MDILGKSNSFVVELSGCDRIEATADGDGFKLKVIGCAKLLGTLTQLKKDSGSQIKNWKIPEGRSHEILLVRELILRARGEWNFPYAHDELCHCRNVLTKTVDQAIISGAHSPEVVSRRTSASTACGTCRPDVIKIIEFRLGKAA